MNTDIAYCEDDLETWQFYIPIVLKGARPTIMQKVWGEEE